MNIFKKIGKAVGGAAKGLVRTVSNPIRGLGRIARGHVSKGLGDIAGSALPVAASLLIPGLGGVAKSAFGKLGSLAGAGLDKIGLGGVKSAVGGAVSNFGKTPFGGKARNALGKLGGLVQNDKGKFDIGKAISLGGSALGLIGQHNQNRANQQYMQDQINMRQGLMDQAQGAYNAKQPLRDAAMKRLAELVGSGPTDIYRNRK
jgi:hypothetical protein